MRSFKFRADKRSSKHYCQCQHGIKLFDYLGYPKDYQDAFHMIIMEVANNSSEVIINFQYLKMKMVLH